MAKRRIILIENGDVCKCSFSFNNLLLRSPLRYTMMERRFLYKLSEAIKMRYEEMELTMRENWDSLVFSMNDKDLTMVGGNTNAARTYKTIRSLAQKSIIQYHQNAEKQVVVDYFHWIDAFSRNTSTNDYTVRVSPELYEYVINLTKSFTVLNLHTAILLESKYSQKFYEICSLYSGDFRFIDPSTTHEIYKKRVIKMSVDAFRFTFGISELRDPRTGEVIEKEKYQRFKTMVEKVALTAQRELFELYEINKCDVWFDFEVSDRNGRGRNGSPKSLRFYIYSREQPKSKDATSDRPWQEGDELWNDNPHKKCHRDIDARWTKKRDEKHYGYKGHTKIDKNSKLIESCHTTVSSMHGSFVRTIGIARAKASFALTCLVYNIFRYCQINKYQPQLLSCKG